MLTGAIQQVINNGSILTVVIKGDDGQVYQGHGDHRPTAQALEALFPDGNYIGQRVSFEMESWGGLAYLGEAV